MKSLIKSSALVLAVASLNFSYANESFTVNNDLFYTQINGPASMVHEQRLGADGTVFMDIKTYYNVNGYMTKSIVSEANGNVTKLTYTPYQDNKRTYNVIDADDQYVYDKLWSSPLENSAYSNNDDIVINTQFNGQGYITYQEVLDGNSNTSETTNFHYLEQGKDKSSVGLKDAEKNMNIVFMTTLEKDNRGSWTKQKEERTDGSVIIHTRTITYDEQSLSSQLFGPIFSNSL